MWRSCTLHNYYMDSNIRPGISQSHEWKLAWVCSSSEEHDSGHSDMSAMPGTGRPLLQSVCPASFVIACVMQVLTKNRNLVLERLWKQESLSSHAPPMASKAEAATKTWIKEAELLSWQLTFSSPFSLTGWTAIYIFWCLYTVAEILGINLRHRQSCYPWLSLWYIRNSHNVA